MRAQADIISAVIIIIIAISLVSAAYFWGIPLIRKRQHTALVERAFKYFDRTNFNSLVKKIEFVAQHGGETTFSLDVDGLWLLYEYDTNNPENNSIQFTFFSTVSNLAYDQGWIPLSSSYISAIGNIGEDPSVVFGRSDKIPDGFNITYKTWFRELDDELQTKGQKINLIAPTDITRSTGRTIRISRGDIKQATEDSKILITTEIEIILV